MKKHDIFEHILLEKLIFGGKGLATAPDGKKIIVTGGCIPGSIINIRILKAKKSHYEGQELDVIKKSPLEVPLPDGFQLYGGAKWLTIRYEDQLRIKEEQVKEAFFHLNAYIKETQWNPIIPSPEVYGYRNKVEFSWGKYISDKEGIHDDFRFGFHAQGQFDRIIDCSYCALADNEINAIFRDIDKYSRESGLPTYDPKTHMGFWRHFVVRKARKTGEIMLIFSVNGEWQSEDKDILGAVFLDMITALTEKYPQIVSLYFLENTGCADIVQGNPVLLFGKETITDELFGLSFEIAPKSFFQVNTLGAEKLYEQVITSIVHRGGILLDLYAGTGTIGILLAKYFSQVYSVELVESASRDGAANAKRNSVANIEFICDRVEHFAKQLSDRQGNADTIVIDPPRDGMHPATIPSLLGFGAKEIIYVSCNPATLARDLEILVGKYRDEVTERLPCYRITTVTPVDMFPHTHHIETVVRLERI